MVLQPTVSDDSGAGGRSDGCWDCCIMGVNGW